MLTFRSNVDGNRDSFFENGVENTIRKEKHSFKVYPPKDHQSIIPTIWEQNSGKPEDEATSGIDKTKLLIFKADLEFREEDADEDNEALPLFD